MRIRRKPGTKEKLLAMKGLVWDDPFGNAGRWREILNNPEGPLYVELGTGKGKFITTIAELHPQINFVGIEREQEVLLKTALKAQEKGLTNLALLWIDGEHLEEIFAPGEVDRLYLNFPDPWPKRRHAKRRLTHPRFLEKYLQIMKPGAEIHFKTDDSQLFEFSLNEFSNAGWRLKNICLDVANRGPEDNITTEYEEKFREQGLPIYRCEVVLPAAKEQPEGEDKGEDK